MTLYRRCLLAALVLAIAAAAAQAAVFYVDPVTGSPDNDGSAERPWKTVEQVLADKLIRTRDKSGRIRNPGAPVDAGDTLLLRSGYHGEIYYRGAHNDDFITIAAEKGHTPKVRRVFFSDASKWIIRGLGVSPSFAAEYKPDRLIYVVNWGGRSSDFVIEDNTLYSVPDGSKWTAEQWNENVCYGISVICDRVAIRNNRLRYVNHGITISGDTITVENNTVLHVAGDGIVCSANNASLLHNTLKYFYNVNANHDDGIQFHRGRDKITPIVNARVIGNTVIGRDDKVRNPLIHSPQGICNFDSPAINWRIANNLVLVQHHHGITIAGCRGGAIVNNIAYNPYGGRFFAGISLSTTHGGITAAGSVIRNNIVDSKIGYPEADNTADHNIIVTDPHRYFRNASALDMRHKPDSPAIDTGSSDRAPKVDIRGVKRPQGEGLDIGCYEYQPDS